jgi:hypothetical protein
LEINGPAPLHAFQCRVRLLLVSNLIHSTSNPSVFTSNRRCSSVSDGPKETLLMRPEEKSAAAWRQAVK